ncbi:MAG: hypothetical protein MK179_14730 [Pirellulaceae bacterium]|nr:hypothetical protein [Pirellulaceae bacterium]
MFVSDDSVKQNLTTVLGAWLLCLNTAIAEPSESANPMRELLVKSGILESQWNAVEDGTPISQPETDILRNTLFRLPQIQRQQIEAWSRTVLWPELLGSPGNHRGTVFHIKGLAGQLSRQEIPSEEADTWGFSHYHRIDLAVDGAPVPQIIVLARKIPRSWKSFMNTDRPLLTGVSIHGIFFKLTVNEQGQTVPVFVAARIAWQPQATSSELNVTESHVMLARAGMDLSLLDDVRDRQGLLSNDRECFYALMAASCRFESSKLHELAPEDTELHLLLDRQEYPQQRGELVALTGNVKRVVRVAVEAEEIRAHWGIDHYYEINLFVDESVQLKNRHNDENPMHYPRYPIVCCVRELPPGMPVGEDVNEAARVVGFFMKLYAYKTQFTDAQPGQRRQFSPLLISNSPIWFRQNSSTSYHWELIGGTGFVLAVVTIWLSVWRSNHRDKQFQAKLKKRHRDLPSTAWTERQAPDDEAP